MNWKGNKGKGLAKQEVGGWRICWARRQAVYRGGGDTGEIETAERDLSVFNF